MRIEISGAKRYIDYKVYDVMKIKNITAYITHQIIIPDICFLKSPRLVLISMIANTAIQLQSEQKVIANIPITRTVFCHFFNLGPSLITKAINHQNNDQIILV